MNVLWIGYGKMGERMCDRVATGHSVKVLDSGAAQRSAAQANGLLLAENAGEAAAIADVIVASLPHDAAVRSVLADRNGLLAQARRGAVLIETSTISVAASTAVAEATSIRGVGYLRAPVSGTVGAARQGALSTFVSGPDDALERVRPIIECYAKKIIPVGPEEQARVMKLAVNLMVDTLMVSLSEAYALCRKGGVDAKVAIEAISGSAIASPHLAFKADCLLREDYTPTFTVTQTRKDLRLINESARDLGVPVLLGAAVEQIMAAAESTGLGELDYIACGKLVLQMAGL